MSLKSILALVCALSIGFASLPSYAGDIISCDSFENCPDGSVPLTNALLALEARMDALELENAALKASLEANTATDTLAHHTKYTDSESIAAVGPHFSGNHSDLINVTAVQHHAKYTNAEAIEAVGPHSPDYSVLLAGVTRLTDPRTNQDTLRFSNMNVQVVSGSGNTGGTKNGTGNLIIGYNELRGLEDDRTGSHMLLLGRWNNYSSYGGMVAGHFNTASGNYASVSGGFDNTASGHQSSVSGGRQNTASGNDTSVSGGRFNTASSVYASVSGGNNNRASSDYASVSGGSDNTASGVYSSVSGGAFGEAPGTDDWVAGALFQTD